MTNLAHKTILFSLNYPIHFISSVWGGIKAEKLQCKFREFRNTSPKGTEFNNFYISLKTGEQKELLNWIDKNY